jgi:PAS domain S-box-containing protein
MGDFFAGLAHFFLHLFDPQSDFVPPWSSGNWVSAQGWLHIAADLAIFGAFVVIPVALGYYVTRRESAPFPGIIWLFAAFIFACGVVHLVDASLFWRPWYRLSGLVKVITAGVAWATAIAFVRIVPKAVALPDHAKMNAHLQREIHERRAAEERFRIVIEAAPSAMILTNAKGHMIWINSQTERMFRYRREELLGQPVEMLIPDRFAANHPQHREQYFANPQARPMGSGRDLMALRRDGTEFPVEVGLNPIHTADQLMVLSAVVDITDRKRGEASLQQMNKLLEHKVRERTRLVQLLRDIAAICNQSESIPEAVRGTIDRMRVHLNWPLGHASVKSDAGGELKSLDVWSSDLPESLLPFVEETRNSNFDAGTAWTGIIPAESRPSWIPDVSRLPHSTRRELLLDSGLFSMFAFPITIDGEDIAVLEFFHNERSMPDEDLMAVTLQIGNQLGRTIERIELQQAITDSVENEQRRIGQELHDGMVQDLTACSLQAKSLYLELKAQDSQAAEKAASLALSIPNVVKEIRAAIRGLMPVEVDSDGLMTALQQLADSTEQRYRISCSLQSPRPVAIGDNAVANHIFRIAQEAVNNAVKHSGAQHISIGLATAGDGLTLTVDDDGIGIGTRTNGSEPSPNSHSSGMGLRIMRHRAHMIGGTLSVDRKEERGTVVVCHLQPESTHHDV